MKKYLLNVLLVTSLFGGTYDASYSIEQMRDTNATQSEDPFMDGDFVEIKRFNALDFSDSSTLSSNDNLDSVSDTIKSYISEGKNIRIKVIGHSEQRMDRQDERTVDSDTYANAIQNMFRDKLTQKEAEARSDTLASKIVNKLESAGINKELIVKEYRASKDIGFTTATDEGINLSNRVMVTMYVIAPKDKDTDEDGIFDSIDECANTPQNVKVDEQGCPFDSDKDGILDYKDECLDTPVGVSVNEVGCPLDSDNDGVLDYKDDCPDTIQGLSVDVSGCPISRELKLNFEHKSSDIAEDSMETVKKFAEFLKSNPAYKVQVIGHTDSVGKAGDNMRLSFDRSNAVKAALVDDGIDKSRIEALGRGELDPVKTNRTAQGRAMNRRIEVKLFN